MGAWGKAKPSQGTPKQGAGLATRQAGQQGLDILISAIAPEYQAEKRGTNQNHKNHRTDTR